MDQKKIAEVLKTLRKKRQLTQEELAEKLNVSSKTISRWETGYNLPDIGLLIEIADLYQVDIRDILLCDRGEKIMSDEIREVAANVADYSDADKKATAKRTIIASIVGLIAFAAGVLFLIVGAGTLTLFSLISFAAVFGTLCYILLNSTQKYTEANRKRLNRTTIVICVIISAAFLLILLSALTYSWFTQA